MMMSYSERRMWEETVIVNVKTRREYDMLVGIRKWKQGVSPEHDYYELYGQESCMRVYKDEEGFGPKSLYEKYAGKCKHGRILSFKEYIDKETNIKPVKLDCFIDRNRLVMLKGDCDFITLTVHDKEKIERILGD